MAESAAVGSPDLARGEVVKAFVVLSDEYRKKLEGKGKKGEDELILELQVRFPFSFLPTVERVLSFLHSQNFFKSTTAPYKVPRESAPFSLRPVPYPSYRTDNPSYFRTSLQLSSSMPPPYPRP